MDVYLGNGPLACIVSGLFVKGENDTQIFFRDLRRYLVFPLWPRVVI